MYSNSDNHTAIEESIKHEVISKIGSLAEQGEYAQIQLEAVAVIASQLRCNKQTSKSIK